MKASRFPREYRVFNLEENRMMKTKELVSIGFSIAPDGLPAFREKPFDCVVMWKTGNKDKRGNILYEGDICKLAVKNEFGSLTIDYAIMRWNEQVGQFILQLPLKTTQMFEVADVERLGNEFENTELKELIAEIV
jgi:hypothetical protein